MKTIDGYHLHAFKANDQIPQTAMVSNSEQIDMICNALKDVNENRLTKVQTTHSVS